MLSPLLDLAYATPSVKTFAPLRGHSQEIGEKGLYIFAGFDDYRIATPERQVNR
jgi:hypothetical protein